MFLKIDRATPAVPVSSVTTEEPDSEAVSSNSNSVGSETKELFPL